MVDEIYYDCHGNPIDMGPSGDETPEEKKKRDKIFGNDYNSGETGYHDLPDIKADDAWADKYLDHVYEAEDYHVKMSLTEKCNDAFNESQWAELPPEKKFPKDLMPYIFNDLFTALDGQGYAVIDMFTAIAEFMGGSYEKVYWAAGVKVKERLIAECNHRFGSLDNKDINRLF